MGEFEKLVQLLTENNIPHGIRINETYGSDLLNARSLSKFGWKQVYYPSANPGEILSDVVWHYGSYGFEEGLLEQLGLTEYYGSEYTDDVKGWLTAEEVFECWKQHYENRKEQ